MQEKGWLHGEDGRNGWDSGKGKERRERLYRRALPESRTLKEALGCLSREELDDLAYNLCLEGTEGLTMPALIDALVPAAVQFAERWLSSAFDEQYQAFRHIEEKGGLADDFREDDERIDYLCGIAIMAVGADAGKLFWYMPAEIAAVFKKLDSAAYADAVRLNTEIMRLATGLLFYYGFLDYDKLFAMVNSYLEENERLDFSAFMGVMLNGSCWRKDVVGTERGMCCRTLLSASWLEQEQREKESLPFAELSYGKVYDAGKRVISKPRSLTRSSRSSSWRSSRWRFCRRRKLSGRSSCCFRMAAA